MSRFSRRSFLKYAGLTAASGVAAGLGVHSAGMGHSPETTTRKRALRIAFLTDIHVQPELHAEEGLVRCLRHVQALRDVPDLIIQGGDGVMDAFAATEVRTKTQWSLLRKVLHSECSLPIEHCIGNHDIWGWDKKKSGASGKEALFGKQWALEEYELSNRFRSLEKGGWHIIVLDSTYPKGEGEYEARLDEEQFAWLQQDIESVKSDRPILIVSHIPILTACGFFHVPQSEKTGDWVMLGALMHLDAGRIMALMRNHSNVKLCLSGHIHLADRVDYDGVTYFCNGAVCGNWWKGRFRETEPGYGLINLYSDGSFDHEYVAYGWKPEG